MGTRTKALVWKTTSKLEGLCYCSCFLSHCSPECSLVLPLPSLLLSIALATHMGQL